MAIKQSCILIEQYFMLHHTASPSKNIKDVLPTHKSPLNKKRENQKIIQRKKEKIKNIDKEMFIKKLPLSFKASFNVYKKRNK